MLVVARYARVHAQVVPKLLCAVHEGRQNLTAPEGLGSIVLEYLVPVLLGAVLSVARPLAGFVLSQVLRTWRGALVAATAVVGCLAGYPRYSAWLAFAALALLTTLRIVTWVRGPNSLGVIAFAGFFGVNDADGKFRRPKDVAALDVRFMQTCASLLAVHRVQAVEPIRLIDWRPPRMMYEARTYDTFAEWARRASRKCMGVVWGTVSADGHLSNLEFTFNERLYIGGRRLTEFVRDILDNMGQTTADAYTVLELFATDLVAIWGLSRCDLLNRAGRWKDSLLAAADSRAILERTLDNLSTRSDSVLASVLDYQKKRMLPLVLRQQACCLFEGGSWLQAMETLRDALRINPVWPARSLAEFADFYNNYYAYDLITSPLMPRDIVPSPELYWERAQVDMPPIIQLFDQWLYHAPPDLAGDLRRWIDEWFADLAKCHPSNPFVFLYWGDAIKAATRLRWKGEEGPMPLPVLDEVVEKYEQAYRLAPDLPVIASRIAAILGVTASFFPEGTAEFNRRIAKFQKYFAEGSRYFRDVIPFFLMGGAQPGNR